MKIKIIAAVARNGVIGRTKKPCPEFCQNTSSGVHEWAPRETCPTCGGTGLVPANDLPWPPYAEDMAFFKKETMGHAVVMGRLTQESIPSKFFPLAGRGNFIVSRTLPDLPIQGANGQEAYVMPSLSEVVYVTSAYRETLYVIGGARIFAEALPIADELVLTFIDKEYAGDVKFPSTFKGNDGEQYDVPTYAGDQYSAFDCVEYRQGETPELTFTRWVPR